MKDKSLLNDIIFYLFLLIVICILVFVFGKDSNKKDVISKVGIHIKGEVAAPGYYEFGYGGRVKDAILAAGGETENANLAEINMARLLCDGEEIIIPSVTDQSLDSYKGPININTADLYILCKIDGIGESIANNIIAYRQKNGPFKSLDDLKKVDGIGDSKFNRIKDKITIQ